MKAYIIATLMLALIIGGCLAPGCPDADQPVCGSDGNTYANPCLAQQAGVESFEPGACKQCTDSDSGKDLFTAGQAVDNSGTYDDECADGLTVDEMFCEGDEVSVKAIPCPAGYECRTGACVEARCTDSDGGADENEQGTATAGSESETDSCVDSNTVEEYYCSAGKIASRDMDCASGEECMDGACVESQCKDSDGKDTSVKGTTEKGDLSQTDSCMNPSSVREYFCQDNLIKNEIIGCDSGYECDGGKCVETVCVDSDQGKDQYTRGTTTYDDYSQTDTCYSSSSVIEYFCASDTDVDYETIDCGSGHECVNGRCEQLQCSKDTITVDEVDEPYEIVEYDDSDELTLYVGESVLLNEGLVLKLHSISGTDATFRLYLDYEDLQDNDHECIETMGENDSDTDLCGQDTEDIEVTLVNDADDYVELLLEEWYVMEYYTIEGVINDWTDDPSCPEDNEVYPSQMMVFFPYADTSSAGLDLEDMDFMVFGKEAELEDIGPGSITFTLDGEEFDLEDGDNFDYMDEEYEIDLTFEDERLKRVEIDLD